MHDCGAVLDAGLRLAYFIAFYDSKPDFTMPVADNVDLHPILQSAPVCPKEMRLLARIAGASKTEIFSWQCIVVNRGESWFQRHACLSGFGVHLDK